MGDLVTQSGGGLGDDYGIDRMSSNHRLCDFCCKSTAVIYCRADSAKLCLACDREVHSTNPLFTKHTRTQLCDVCDESSATILCSDEDLVLCQNCDWEAHRNRSEEVLNHDRKGLEGFSGCPKVCELMVVFGLEDLGKKVLMGSELESEKDGFDQAGGYGFSDFLVWDTPTVFNLDDLIGNVDSSSGFGISEAPPPLPKVNKATCGKHKEEILRQLRDLAKCEPGFSEADDLLVGFSVDDRVLQSRDVVVDEKRVIGDAYEEHAQTWFSDSNKPKMQTLTSTSTLSITVNEDSVVPEKPSDTGGCPSQLTDGHADGISVPTKTNALPYAPKVHSHEFNSQERETAVSRYREKKKNRRYEKHIRYESRKLRAESRTRIKGRFAKSTTSTD